MRAMPVFAGVFMLVMLASVALPGTNGFISEFLILLGVFQSYPVFGVLGTTTAILSAIYMLWMYQKTMFESPSRPSSITTQHDLKRHEMMLFTPVIVLIIGVGVFPNFFVERLTEAVSFLLGGR
jgi:NADH-quinone oxidoreductase subunit M